MTSKNKRETKEDKILYLMKKGVAKFIKVETTGAGLINLIFGLALTVFVFITCLESTFMTIIKAIFPSVNSGIPWYANLIYFLSLGVFFLICFNTMCKINDAKDKIKEGI